MHTNILSHSEKDRKQTIRMVERKEKARLWSWELCTTGIDRLKVPKVKAVREDLVHHPHKDSFQDTPPLLHLL